MATRKPVGFGSAILAIAFVLFLGYQVDSALRSSRSAAPPVVAPVKPKAAVAAAVASQPSAGELQLVQVCRTNIDRFKESYRKKMKAGDYWMATLEIRQCAEALGDKGLLALVADAELKSYLKDIRSSKTAARERVRLIEQVKAELPLVAKQNEAEFSRILAQAPAQELADEAAAKKKRGVTIGMSPQDVLASSWGKPQSVNKTTNAYGVREQWVYGNGDYLYFENSILMSIQN